MITIPGHWLGLRLPWPPRRRTRLRKRRPIPGGSRAAAFVALTVVLSLGTFMAFAVVITLVPLLVERGVDLGTAAVAMGLGGAGQVAGRLGYAGWPGTPASGSEPR